MKLPLILLRRLLSQFQPVNMALGRYLATNLNSLNQIRIIIINKGEIIQNKNDI